MTPAPAADGTTTPRRTVNIRQLAEIVADDTGLTLSDTEDTLWAAFDAIARTLAAGESFTLSNFGTFATYTHATHKSFNIGTRESMVVPAYRAARFRATGRLREMVRDGDTGASIRKLPKGSRTAAE
ncbi:HU family DNA-binding protein [Streptomyces sp. KR55]|uniref:HU family DNA-binding protein n=1 Tax=Streptomyces sp. KR55 TaxID=3457425 RepID=UPI003FD1764D